MPVTSASPQLREHRRAPGTASRRPPPLWARAAPREAWFRSLDERLRRAYGTPERRLGNLRNPLDECVYIILSFQTDVPRARLTWRALKKKYPTWDGLLRAREASVARLLQPGGLHRQKTDAIRRLLRQVKADQGTLSLEYLRSTDDALAEKALLRLHGLSWKGARCVLMYSLRRAYFPVDVNIFRIFRRMGVLPGTAVYRRRTLHDLVQEWVPPPARRSLHVNLVVHGQEVCRPLNPKCKLCPVAAMCRMNLKCSANR